MCWVYKYIEQGVYDSNDVLCNWVVGYYVSGQFEPISYFEDETSAINRVSKLNGGQ